MPELLALLTLDGCIVTADAMHFQKTTAAAIVARGGDYVLAGKGNQKTLLDDVQLLLDDPDAAPDDAAQTVDGDHGRIATRSAAVVHDVPRLAERHGFPGLEHFHADRTYTAFWMQFWYSSDEKQWSSLPQVV